jgi:2-polyprenyl-3-methyl-5-hydroxy-6-metoxy-1,4-benzoquinol methylase
MSNRQRAADIVSAYPNHTPDHKVEYYRYHRFRFTAMLAAIMDLPGKRVLEIGVNPGQFTEMLVQAGFSVSGTDLFPEHRADVWHRLGVEVRWWNIDIEAPPYPDGSFDIIVFSEVIEHLANPPLEALETFSRLLAPGGYLCVSTPNQFYFKSRLRTLFDVVLMRPFDHDDEFKRWALLRADARYYTHSRLFSMAQLEWLSAQSGYTVANKEYIAAYEPVGLEFSRFFRAPHRWLAKGFIAVVTQLIPSSRSMLLAVFQRPRV